jgi:hypothetical protein
MPLFSWKSFLRCLAPAQRPVRRRPRPLQLERLESRLVPTVTLHGGPVLANVHVETLFDGSGWNDGGTYFNQTGTLGGFSQFIVNSPYMDMLSAAGYGVGRGTFSQGPIALTDLSEGTTQDSDIQNLIQGYIDNGYVVSPDSNTLYMVFVQPFAVVIKGSQDSANDFFAYHSGFAGHDQSSNPINIHYIVCPYQNNFNGPPYANFSNPIDGITAAASQQLADAVTDPDRWAGTTSWHDDSLKQDIGDVLSGRAVRLDGWAVQEVVAQDDSPLVPVPAWATLSAGHLTVNGTSSGGMIFIGTSEFGGVSVYYAGESIGLRPDDVSSVTVNTAGAGTTIDVEATEAGVPLTIVGGGPNTVFIGGDSGSVQGILGTVNIENPRSADTITVDDSNDTTARTVTLSTLATNPADSEASADPWGQIIGLAPAPINYEYHDTQGMTVQTGSGADRVTVSSLPLSHFNLDAGAATDTLVGPNATNTWQVSGANSGSLDGNFTFSGIENLTGGSGVDVFRMATGGTLTELDGGGGTNTLNYGLDSIAASVNLQTRAATGLNAGHGGGFVRIQSVIGNSMLAERLIGPNSPTLWQITGGNAGSAGPFTFSGISNLQGGTASDTFKFSPAGVISGSIAGGGGSDWLDYSLFTTPVIANLATGTATHVGAGAAGKVTQIQDAVGGNANDLLTGNTLGNILIGGGGNDTITGGSGRSLLIGGVGADTIKGGSADDILISGTTNFDSNHAALMAILSEWRRTDKTYAQRIADLKNGGGLNGSTKLVWGTTVHADATVDTLTGNGGLDWFFANLGPGGILDHLTDRNNGGAEQVN